MDTVLAYLAGAMDSDGSFGIMRSTYAMRVRGDASQPIYGERAALKQVTEAIPRLLHETFGGVFTITKGHTPLSKPLWLWQVTDCKAATCAEQLLPFLRVKSAQAKCLLELRATKQQHSYKKLAYWFEREHPSWREMPLVTFREAAALIGYKDAGLPGMKGFGMIRQAVANGSLLAIPYDNSGIEKPRIPRALVELYAAIPGSRGKRRPAQLIAMREELWQRCRELNRIGTGEHPIYMRTGCYAPAA
jgi:hypothetical protein